VRHAKGPTSGTRRRAPRRAKRLGDRAVAALLRGCEATCGVARQMLRVAQVVMLRSSQVGAGSWECS
jgi:hypothetical protein